MASRRNKESTKITRVETLKHTEARRRNIPTAELQAYMAEEEAKPKQLLYPRNPDLDPQLVWRGKDEEDRAPLAVETVPVYIQEKIQPKAIVEDLRRQSAARREAKTDAPDLFADFNGLPDEEARLEFYQHDQNWSNRMILGDSLLVMNSLAEKEGLRGQVQMIYVDPPYGINFSSNWQISTKSNSNNQAGMDAISREPEVIKAFRDTWSLGIHSYLSYLRDRLLICRALLAERGSIFVQINDENVHLVRSLLDEIFGGECAVVTFVVKKKGSQMSSLIDPVNDYILWYSKTPRANGSVKFKALFEERELDKDTLTEFGLVRLHGKGPMRLAELMRPDGASIDYRLRPSLIFSDYPGAQLLRLNPLTSGGYRKNQSLDYEYCGRTFSPGTGNCWKHTAISEDSSRCGMDRLAMSDRLAIGQNQLRFVSYFRDFPYKPISNWWDGLGGAPEQVYVVQTNTEIIKRCLLMTTDPGDLVLDPTCGSGTTAFVAEQWGRRWITIDASRVALTLARARLMAARFPYYYLKDSDEGAQREAENTGRPPEEGPFGRDIRHGFVNRRATHITSGLIANNAEIDVIWERWQAALEPLRAQLNKAIGKNWEDWQIPRDADETWPASAKEVHVKWGEARRKRQTEIDASIARNAEVKYFYDRPYEQKGVVRVTGPFTVESLSPHRVLPTDEEDEALLDALDEEARAEGREPAPRRRRKPVDSGEDDFVTVVLENLKTSGVQNTKKNERLSFVSLKPWAGGKYIHAEGRYMEGEKERRAAITIGPEYGTVSRELVRLAAREAIDLFDVLVVCGFAFDPHVGEDTMRLGRLTVLKARMNQDLHMAEHLKKTGAGNLFVVFGEPEIELRPAGDGQWQVEIKGVDVFDPTTGEVRSGGTGDIACWFVDTDYNEESFFVRHAYFLGGNDPYEKLRRTLKAEIDEEGWSSLYSAVSRPFPKPKTGKLAVKVINHFGDEVLKVYPVS